jgi:hypothetical protein
VELLRVMVIGLGGLVGEMIEAAVDAEPGLRLVRCAAEADPGSAIREADPHVVVVASPDERLPPVWVRVLSDRPGIRVVAVDPDRGSGVLYEMRPHAVPMGDVSPADIVSVLQGIRTGSGEGTRN